MFQLRETRLAMKDCQTTPQSKCRVFKKLRRDDFGLPHLSQFELVVAGGAESTIRHHPSSHQPSCIVTDKTEQARDRLLGKGKR